MKLDIYVPYEKMYIGIAFGVIGVNVTVTKNRKTVSNRVFPVNKFSYNWFITMELGIYVAYEERKIWIEFGVSRVKIKVKVTVTKNRKTVSG